MLKNITKREKFIGIITISVVFVAIIYNFAIEPLIEQWNTLGEEIRAKESLLRKNNRILRDKDNIERTHSEYTAYFKTEVLSAEEESAKALSSIEKVARNTNVRITNIKPLTIKSFKNYNKYTFRVTTESQIERLCKFIYELQSSQQLLKVERMVLKAKERSPNIIKAILHITKISAL